MDTIGPMKEDNWRAQSDGRTLMDAAAIKADAARHAAAVAHLKGEKAKIAAVTRVRRRDVLNLGAGFTKVGS